MHQEEDEEEEEAEEEEGSPVKTKFHTQKIGIPVKTSRNSIQKKSQDAIQKEISGFQGAFEIAQIKKHSGFCQKKKSGIPPEKCCGILICNEFIPD